MLGTTFPYRTKVAPVRVGGIGGIELQVEQLVSLDETIDEFFKQYEESGDAELFGSLCPYFGQPWPAGIALASHALSQVKAWQGASVLELGCGLALPSIVLAKNGFTRLLATDIHPDVPPFLQANCRLNNVLVDSALLDWQGIGEGAQIILGSDLLYDREQAPELLKFLERVSWNEAVLADPGRPYWDSFLRTAKERWTVEEFLFEGIFFARLLRE